MLFHYGNVPSYNLLAPCRKIAIAASYAKIDLRRMRCVIEVARARSITAAAETLAVTQPALTRSIADVEQTLGTRLFERLPRGIQLTEVGEVFVTRARRILGDVDDLLFDLREGQNVLAGRVRLGIAPRDFQRYATAALADLARSHPSVTVETITGTAQELCPRLLRGELDLMLGSTSYLRRWRGLSVGTLAPTRVACLFRRDHPIRRLPNIAEADVFRYPVVFPESVEPLYSDLARRYAELGLPPLQPRYTSDDFDTVAQLVQASDAYAPLTYAEADADVLRESFFLLADTVRISTQHLGLALAPGRVPSAPAEQLEHFLRTRIADGAAANTPIRRV